LPDGYGIFIAGEWLHCGQFKLRSLANEQVNNLTWISQFFKLITRSLRAEVKVCVFREGRKVSVNSEAGILKLTNKNAYKMGAS
jgi:hypothetical protein